jgi:(2Fe-2S) ferredoxin
MSYYRHHVFFCTNLREDGRACCQHHDAQAKRDYFKARVKAEGLAGPGGVRVNSAGCLDRCELGPVVVVYPQAVWYSYVDEQDLDEILEQHLKQGRVVERLRLPDATDGQAGER